MGFRPSQRFTRFLAAVVLMSLGAGLMFPFRFIGVAVIAFGFCLAVPQAMEMWRARRNPYDLSLLREIHEREAARDEPEEDNAERDMIYCHRCNLSVPETYSICPECGSILGRPGCG